METVRFAFRDEKINIYAMTYGNLTGPYSHQIFLCKKEPFSKKYNGPFLLIPKKTTNKYNPSIKGLDYINKIENLRYDYSFIAYIDSYIKIHISEDIFKTLCNTGFFDIWDPKEPIDYFSERHEGYLAIFRVFKTNQIHDDIEFKGRNFYFELNEPFSTQLGQPVINDDQFQETKSTLIDVLNSNNSLIEYLEPGKKEIFQIRLEEILDYDDNELNEINEIVEQTLPRDTKPTWNGRIEKQEFTEVISNGKPKPKRKASVAANALAIAEYKCEYDGEKGTFLRRNGKQNYTEPHHLIPISKYANFAPNSLDVEENIVSLCSYCHNLLHYGRLEDKKPILKKLFNERQLALSQAGLKMDAVEDLMKYYK